MKLFSKDGVEMMEVKTIELDGDRLVLKGKMMGAMAAIIHIKPVDMWAAYKLFPWAVKLRIPMLLVKGWAASRKTPAK